MNNETKDERNQTSRNKHQQRTKSKPDSVAKVEKVSVIWLAV
jgi:hypothetical protein